MEILCRGTVLRALVVLASLFFVAHASTPPTTLRAEVQKLLDGEHRSRKKMVFPNVLRRRSASALKPSATEIDAFLKKANGRVEKAAQLIATKADWRRKLGRVTIRQVAPFYKGDGYTVVLEGLRTKAGFPVVLANGMMYGSVDDIQRQTTYYLERVECLSPKNSQPACLVVVNASNPTFRFPDANTKKGAIEVIDKYYPWAGEVTTVFLGVPAPVRWTFKLCKPFLPASLFEKLRFAASPRDLDEFIDPQNRLTQWGGTADFDIGRYVKQRSRLEFTPVTSEIKRYKGERSNLAAFDIDGNKR